MQDDVKTKLLAALDFACDALTALGELRTIIDEIYDSAADEDPVDVVSLSYDVPRAFDLVEGIYEEIQNVWDEAEELAHPAHAEPEVELGESVA
jgi:hypothetical protein